MADKKDIGLTKKSFERSAGRAMAVAGVVGGILVADGGRRVVQNPPGTHEHEDGGVEALMGLTLAASTRRSVRVRRIDGKNISIHNGPLEIFGSARQQAEKEAALESEMEKLRAVTGYEAWVYDDAADRYATFAMTSKPGARLIAARVKNALAGIVKENATADIKMTDSGDISVGATSIDQDKLEKATDRAKGPAVPALA